MTGAPATDVPDLSALADRDAPLAAVMKAVRAGEAAAPDAPVLKVGLSATATLDIVATMLRRQALLAGLTAEVHQGALDSHLDNVERFAEDGVDHLVLVTTLEGILPAFEARAATMDDELLEACAQRIAGELGLVLDAAAGRFQTIDVALPHRTTAPTDTAASRAVDAAVAHLRAAVEQTLATAPGARALHVGDALAAVGYDAAIDARFGLRFGAPYTGAAANELARRLVLATRASAGLVPKVLVLDCDNTLWGGILGEDGIDGIALDPLRYPGNAFWTVQQIVAGMQAAGVLVCLASKNNPEDVAEALEAHPAMVLRDEHLVLQKVSWDDKVDSLVAIAEELNVGLDSLVFADDSAFEIEAVRTRLPMVTTFQVPREAWQWPAMAQEIAELFTTARSGADAGKTEQYRARAAARAEESRHGSREDYLRSLGLTVDVHVDERARIARIAELTQKSNQFNLTTKRYGEGEIAAAMDDPDAAVLSLHVRDRFGEQGLTGVLVLRFAAPVVEVEAFLMSCRVLGRGIEQACWTVVTRLAAEHGCTDVRARFAPTAKNAQVADFYDRLGLPRDAEHPDGAVDYAGPVTALPQSAPDHLEIHVL